MFTIADNTAGVQRFAANNSFNTELGSAIPTSALSVNGHAILSGSTLAQNVAAPPAMPRTAGSIAVAPMSVAVVNLPTSAGLASINGSGAVVAFNGAKNQITIANTDIASTSTLGYGSF